MKPNKSILDQSFKYVSSSSTSVDATWRKYGWKPVSPQERAARFGDSVPAEALAAESQRVIDLKVVRAA
jgi:hypothetical protein